MEKYQFNWVFKMSENMEEDLKQTLINMFPVLKYQTYLTPYFVKEKDAISQIAKERIRKTQKQILKKVKEIQGRVWKVKLQKREILDQLQQKKRGGIGEQRTPYSLI